MRELGASLVFLHHNNGLHFHQLVATDILVVTLVETFVWLVAKPDKDVRITVWMFPVMFLFQLLSSYVKVSRPFLQNGDTVYQWSIDGLLQELYDRMTWYVTRYFQSSEDRSRLMLADMLPKEVLEEFSGDRLQLAYHHRRITFLFADIVGFTSYAKTVEATDVRCCSLRCLESHEGRACFFVWLSLICAWAVYSLSSTLITIGHGACLLHRG